MSSDLAKLRLVARSFALRAFCLSAVAAAGLLLPASAYASNEAMLKLLRILRDRGSITSQEYEELRLATETPEAATSSAAASIPATSPGAVPALPLQAPAQGPAVLAVTEQALDSRVQALEAQVANQDPEGAVKKALAGKWYERLGLRGYTQFRFTQVGEGEGPSLEVPADRSVNENESFLIRRGRFVVSGDVSNHLALYAQADFNGSTGAADYSLQMRDLYADVNLDANKAFRIRLGQSKVPYGWVNMQSSQNRAPFERPDALNSAVEGERDLGVYLMWASPAIRQRYRDLVSQGLKGSGDYGSVAVGLYSGQGLNRSDQNGEPHVVARWAYPFELANGQFFELGVQGYHGKYVTTTHAITSSGLTVTPQKPADGIVDERVALTAVWYPQPFGMEAEWNIGRGPELSDDLLSITRKSLQGGYVQVAYRNAAGTASLFPFVRWQRYDGGRKFARNSPHMDINELDFGVELARWTELELTMSYTRTFERTRTGVFPYETSRDANRFGFQVQWNY
jgi:hypothetical protein